MRQKKQKLVVAFDTTTAALDVEGICTLGRIIPLPSEIRAGCGLAYCVDVEYSAEIKALLEQYDIDYFAMQVVELY